MRQMALIVLIFYVAGCSKWVVSDHKALEEALSAGDKEVRITDLSGNTTQMRATSIEEDMIFGHLKVRSQGFHRKESTSYSDRTSTVSLAGASLIEVRQGDIGTTVGMIVVTGMVVGLLGYLVFALSYPDQS